MTADQCPGCGRMDGPPCDGCFFLKDPMTPITDRQLRDIAQAMSDDCRIKLAGMRGGCLCHISPPCFACSEPLTEEEADYLGLLPEVAVSIPPEVWRVKPEVDHTDYMAAVRAMSRGAA